MLRKILVISGLCVLISTLAFGIVQAQVTTNERHCFEQSFQNGEVIYERCIENGIVTESGVDITPVTRTATTQENEDIACIQRLATAQAILDTPIRAEITQLSERVSALETVLEIHGTC